MALLAVTPVLVACPGEPTTVTGTVIKRTEFETGVILQVQRPTGRTRDIHMKTRQVNCTIGALYPDCVQPELMP